MAGSLWNIATQNTNGTGNASFSANPVQLGIDAAKGAKQWAGEKNAPTIGENPYLPDWRDLVTQLQQQAMGNGPSLAGDAYKQANATGMRNVMAMSRGGTAGAARAGQMQMGRMQQGLSQGYANARLQEQLMARQMLAQALSGAGNAWFQPQQANMNAEMNTQSNGQQLLSFGSQLAGIGGQFLGGKPPAAQPTYWTGPPGGSGF
jgi:hypothetical protein